MSTASKSYLLSADAACILLVYAKPNARKSALVGEYNGHLKIQIAAVPEDGKANDELINFLSKIFKLPKKSLSIIKGETSKCKQVLVNESLDIIARRIKEVEAA